MERVDYESLVIQDISNMNRNGELKLDPWYQRRSVWNEAQKGYLINTLFVQKPIPTVYIRHYLDIEKEKSIKEVVDGQQRFRAMLGYLEDEFSARHPEHKNKVLCSQLTSAQRTALKMTKVPIGVLVDADETDVIEIFGRLNSISKTLNTQEKRNARFSGAFKQFCLSTAARYVKFWRASGVFSATDISRMLEVQFVSDIVLNMLNGLSDFSATRLDDLYNQFDADFPDEADIAKRFKSVFEKLGEIGEDVIRDTVFSRSPLFFSLFLLMDEKPKLKASALADVINHIDNIFNDEDAQDDDDREFIAACSASTQRIKSRKIRTAYLEQYF